MRIQISLGVMLIAMSPWSLAQSRADTEFAGVAVVSKKCPITTSLDVANDKFDAEGESALALAGGAFLAGVAGDVVSAGMNALGAALEEASREKGFSVVSGASFAYYQLTYTKPQGTGPGEHAAEIKMEPRLGDIASLCLAMSYGDGTAKSAQPPVGKELTSEELKRGGSEWKKRGMPANPQVYLEGMLQKRADGFVVRPTLVWYREALPGAPKKTLQTEAHFTFSTPSAPSGEAAAIFALARLRLPAIAPGTILRSSDLARYVSPVMPARPTAGSPDTAKANLMTILSDLQANTKEIATLERALPRARAAASNPKATKEEKTLAVALGDQLDDAKAKTPRLRERVKRLESALFPVIVGTTNVTARFTVIRNANQFGLAIAKSLQTRGKALGEAVTTSLMPESRAQAWTSQDTTYIAAMNGVLSAQYAVDSAKASGDATAIFNAELALKNAKAAANGAAAASNRTLPYPDIALF